MYVCNIHLDGYYIFCCPQLNPRLCVQVLCCQTTRQTSPPCQSPLLVTGRIPSGAVRTQIRTQIASQLAEQLIYLFIYFGAYGHSRITIGKRGAGARIACGLLLGGLVRSGHRLWSERCGQVAGRMRCNLNISSVCRSSGSESESARLSTSEASRVSFGAITPSSSSSSLLCRRRAPNTATR